MSQTKNSRNNQSSNSSGHGFGLGLFVGGMAGIASYYLFGTKQGQELKNKLVIKNVANIDYFYITTNFFLFNFDEIAILWDE